MSKSVVKLVSIILLFIFFKSRIFGISDNFKFIINTIGIPRYNVYMEEINEDIYYAYNVFAYSNPQNLSWHINQRFKCVPHLGKWTRYNGVYCGDGERGEYYLLGTSYSGSIISNVYFPPDLFPETTPDKWIYLVTDGAYESWLDKGRYRYDEQVEYMKNADLLFDEINFVTRTTNSYNLIPYGITVNRIGTNKITLDTAPTWKTNGIATARRKTDTGKIRNAIFAVAPMAANAEVLSKIDIQNNFVIEKNEDKIDIPIKISAEAINLSNHVYEKHIKEIVSILYINNKEIARVSGSKIVKVDKNILFTVSRDEYPFSKTYPLDIKVKSYLYTEFSTDGLMQHEIQKTISLQVVEKEVIPIENIELSVLEKENNNLVIRPLVQTTNTLNLGSKGIVETGKYMLVKIGKKTELPELKCYINNNQTEYEQIFQDDRFVVLKIHLNEKLTNTIKSWNYLRNDSKNYFDINFNDIGERVLEPNILKILCNSNYEEILKFDAIDKYSNNINYCFTKDVLNINEIKDSILLNDWIKNE